MHISSRHHLHRGRHVFSSFATKLFLIRSATGFISVFPWNPGNIPPFWIALSWSLSPFCCVFVSLGLLLTMDYVLTPVVLDNGSGMIKAGYAGEEIPKSFFPS